VKEELQSKRDIPKFSFLIELRSKSHSTTKTKPPQNNLEEDIKELSIMNNKSNREVLFKTQKDFYTDTEIEFRKIMQEKGSKLEGVKSLLKHIMEKHNPILTQNNLEINKYKKGYRETLEYSKTRSNRSVELKRKCEAYLKSQIQSRKDQYIKNVEKKLSLVNANKSLKPIKRKSNPGIQRNNNKDMNYTTNKSIIQVITRRNTRPKLIYGSIKAAINDLTNDMKCIQLSDYKDKLTKRQAK
jgi:hypothetical protein